MRGGFILLWLAGLAWGAENGAVSVGPMGCGICPIKVCLHWQGRAQAF